MGILEGKKILITGVLTSDSIAYSIAKEAIAEGAQIKLTGFGRGLSLTQRTAKKLDGEIEVLELDITDENHRKNIQEHLKNDWNNIDGAVHSIGFAPENCLGDDFFAAEWEDVSTAIEISSYSLRALSDLVTPLMTNGGSIVGLTFDASVSWPAYNWMGVAKSALESLNRYLARELGPDNIRTNLIAAGPLKTIAAKSIPGFKAFEDEWIKRSPLTWDINDATPVGKASVALLSDFFPATTGSIIHVDGGYHSIGA